MDQAPIVISEECMLNHNHRRDISLGSLLGGSLLRCIIASIGARISVNGVGTETNTRSTANTPMASFRVATGGVLCVMASHLGRAPRRSRVVGASAARVFEHNIDQS